ncbi:beta family protein [Pandoraea sputorum]|uniref:beta family protein n=1 Tax=Pandoraea sputorum TaxID=93222 RepID=UPI0012427ACD|nr:beta family protein [Pandoraea sputorum]VVE77435.1 hypothetical protein PSP31120_01290 [Pandoraea sputorum]
MFEKNHYVPVLKWRQGEYMALSRLDNLIKDNVTPLLEIPTEAWDFEADAPAKSIDDHLAKFGGRLKQKWGARRCFVDSPYYDDGQRVDGGVHHLSHIFELARKAGAAPVPVVGVGRGKAYVGAVKDIVAKDGRGACVRLVVDDFGPSLHADLGGLLQRIGITVADADLVLDCGADVVSSPKTQAIVWKGLLDQLPVIGKWRSLAVVGTAFPDRLPASTFRPSGRVPRNDWLGYKALVGILGKDSRIPTFGDYCVSHPQTEMMDPRMLDPNAKVKYTIDDEWFIALGTQVKKNGRAQYANVCATIVKAHPPVFLGPKFSYGDEFIDACAAGTGSTGGTSTWPTVASNHHITKVVRDVASLHAASGRP